MIKDRETGDPAPDGTINPRASAWWGAPTPNQPFWTSGLMTRQNPSEPLDQTHVSFCLFVDEYNRASGRWPTRSFQKVTSDTKIYWNSRSYCPLSLCFFFTASRQSSGSEFRATAQSLAAWPRPCWGSEEITCTWWSKPSPLCLTWMRAKLFHTCWTCPEPDVVETCS